MSRIETAATITSSMAAALGGHLLCCGIMPMMLNASAAAMLGSIGAQIGFAILTTILVATAVTCYENHRHQAVCRASSHDHFKPRRHFLRNLVIGGLAYAAFSTFTHLPFVHDGLETLFHI